MRYFWTCLHLIKYFAFVYNALAKSPHKTVTDRSFSKWPKTYNILRLITMHFLKRDSTTLKCLLGKFWQKTPRTIATEDNHHSDSCRLGQLPPTTIATQDNCHPANCHRAYCHLRRLPPRTIATKDNCYPDNWHVGQLPPTTVATWTTAT